MTTEKKEDAKQLARKKIRVDSLVGRLWLYALGATLLATLVYGITLVGYVYPGESAHLFTQWMGMDALDLPRHPVWGAVVKAVGGMSFGASVAARLNLVSLVCGALSAGLVCLLVGVFVRLTISQEDTVKYVDGASAVAGIVASVAFIFSTAVWQSSTHLEYRMFDVFLALALFALFVPMVRWPKLLLLLAGLLGVGVAAGLVESVIFLPLLPVFLLGVVVTAVRVDRGFYLPAELFLTMFVVFFLVFVSSVTGSFLDLPSAEAGGMLNSGDVLDRMMAVYAHEMRQWFGGGDASLETSLGWLFILILAVLPFVACGFAAPRGLNNERTWSQYFFHSAMTISGILALATPLAPADLMRLSGNEPVATTTLVCVYCGYLAAYWFMLARVPLPVVEYEKERMGEIVFGRRLAPVVLGLFLGIAALSSLVNAFSTSTDRGTFADICANEVLDRLGTRTWLVTDGTLDDNLRNAAASRGQELNLICLQRAEDDSYLKELGALVRAKGLSAGHANLARSAELGVLPFLEDWLMGDPDIASKVAIFGAPDLWFKAELQPVPECIFFGGVKDVKTLDGAKALADFNAFWEKIEPRLNLEGVKGSRALYEVTDALDRKRLWLRRHVGLIANNLGVALQDLGMNKEAYGLYDLVLKTIDCDNVCALFNEFEMARSGVKEAAVHKTEIERQLKAIVDDPQRRYSLWSLSRFYGYIRAPEIFARMGHEWARSGQRGEALAQLRRASDFVPVDRRAGLLNMMAAIYASGNQVQKSREVYQQVLARDAGNHDALMGLMNLALQNGEIDEAKRLLTKAVEASPNKESSGFDWALLHLMNNDFASARLAIQKVTYLQPKSLRAWSLLAGVLLQQYDQMTDKKEQAKLLDELENSILPKMEAIADSPRDYHVLMTRAFVLLRRGGDSRAKARDVLVMAYAMRPNASAVGDMILNVDISLNDGESAAKHARRILRQDRRNRLANYVMGSLRLKEADYATAEEYLRISVEADHPIAAAQNDLAEVLRRRGKSDEAERFARAAIKTAPELYVAWETLGSSLLDQNKELDEAEKCVQTAIDLSKKNKAEDIRMLITLARVQIAKKDLGRARGTLRTLRGHKGKSDLSTYDLEVIEKLESLVKGK